MTKNSLFEFLTQIRNIPGSTLRRRANKEREKALKLVSVISESSFSADTVDNSPRDDAHLVSDNSCIPASPIVGPLLLYCRKN